MGDTNASSSSSGSTTRLEQMMLKMAETVSRLETENAAMRAQIGSNDVMAQQLRNEAAYEREAWRSEFDNHQTFYAEVKANMEEATARDHGAPSKRSSPTRPARSF